MNKRQEREDNVRSLLSEFYEIIEESRSTPEGLNKTHPPSQHSGFLSSDRKEHNVDVDDEDGDGDDADVVDEDGNDAGGNGNGDDDGGNDGDAVGSSSATGKGGVREGGGKWLHTCSTEAVESRQKCWEDSLRSIKQNRESEEGESHDQVDSLQHYELRQKPSPWAHNNGSPDYTSLEYSANHSHRNKPARCRKKPAGCRNKKRTEVSWRESGREGGSGRDKKDGGKQLLVELKYGEGRRYQIGMRDLNKRWFWILNQIHQR